MPDGEPDEDHGDELEVDEEEISACAPYLARQMSCIGRMTPGVKDTPFLGSARGAKEAENHLTRVMHFEFFGEVFKQSTQRRREFYPGSGRPEAKSPTPACLD